MLVDDHILEVEIPLRQEPDLFDVFSILAYCDSLIVRVDIYHGDLSPANLVNHANVLNIRGLQGVPEEFVGVLNELEDLDLLIRQSAEPFDLFPAFSYSETDLSLLYGEDYRLLIYDTVDDRRTRHILEKLNKLHLIPGNLDVA
jgi:hypothetical protein